MGGSGVPERAWHGIDENPYNPHAWVLGDPQIGPRTWIGAFTVIDGSGGLQSAKAATFQQAHTSTHTQQWRAV